MGFEPAKYRVADLISSGVIEIGDGYRAKNSELTSEGIPFARAANINDGFKFEGADCFPVDRLKIVGRKVSTMGDVVFTSKGTVGRFAYVDARAERFVYSPQLCYWRSLDHERVNPRYLYFWMQSQEFLHQINYLKNQTDMADYVSLRDQRKMTLTIPEPEVQKGIAIFLGGIDDRISNLRQTNATLEAIAQALFKSWFVDFDPVRAKAEGREPEGMDAATAAMFPSEFEDSELGPIPKGWRVSTVGESANVIDCLHAKKPELLDAGLAYLQLNCIRADGLLETTAVARISEADYEKWTSRIEASPGDCVITNVGRVGAVAQIPAGFTAAIGRNMTGIRPKPGFPPTFLIELLMSDCMRREIEHRTDAGTILSALNVKNIPKLRFVLAPKNVLNQFERTCRPLRLAMEGNLQRRNVLAELRDTLLPRLISGKLRLSDAQAAVDDALV
jgi:type I restriction enzyme, S subunit